jgi:hypothetical protein
VPLQKEKTLPSGETGNYWAVSELSFTRKNMTVKANLSLYKSSALAAAGAPPLPCSHEFTFTITQQEIAGGSIVSVAYTKILALIAELHPPISGSGDPASHYPDLLDATVVA